MTSPWILHHEDCLKAMAAMESDSVDAIVTDPPYGLEFMGKDWDSFGGKADWQAGGGFAKPGIGERAIAWPSFSANSKFGAANPTCGTCGGRARGKKSCSCATPNWKPIGKRRNAENEGLPDDMTGSGASQHSQAFQEFSLKWATECLRVAKPGAYLLAFGGTRMYHRLAVAIEDAGWELRDCFSYLYGSGFPKSLDVSKAIDKAAGAERTDVVGVRHRNVKPYDDGNGWNSNNTKGNYEYKAPATDAAKQWAGFGTALKPAWEPIIVARKPLISTVAATVLKHGTGGINIDACRIASGAPPKGYPNGPGGKSHHYSSDARSSEVRPNPWEPATQGRWPSNVILGCCGNDPHDPDCAVRLLDEQTGVLTTNAGTVRPHNATMGYGGSEGSDAVREIKADSGGPSRFFYTAKASRSERTHGGEVVNLHPTVKPISLMRYLVRLVTPPGGSVLDPFCGSGSTGVAAILEGFNFVGSEMEAESVKTSKARLELAVLVSVGGVKNPWEDEPAETAPAEEAPVISSIEDLFGFDE